MNEATLLLGTNLGDRMNNLKRASGYIEDEIGKIEKKSSVYESEPWGFEAESSFFNMVLIVDTVLKPEALLRKIHSIEKKMGRVRTGFSGYSSRIIDIDILFYNMEILNFSELRIPHPKLHERRFTLEPLVEIVPLKNHPVLKKNISELLAACKDNLSVKRTAAK